MTALTGKTHRHSLFRFAALAAVTVLGLFLAGCGMGKAVTDYVDSKDAGIRKRVVIAPFTSAVKEQQAQADALHKSLREALGRSSGLVMVDIAELQEEMARVEPEVRHPEERALTAGRRLGLTAIVAGNLVDLSIQYKLKGIYGFRDNKSFLGLEAEMKVLNPGTGTVAGQVSQRREQEVDDIVAEGIKNGAAPDPKLVAKLMEEVTKASQEYLATTIGSQPWVGSVLEVAGDRVRINLGADGGLGVGDTLTVYGVAERLRTAGGQEIALPGSVVGRVRLVEMGRHSSWAVALEGSDKKGAIEPGQSLRTR